MRPGRKGRDYDKIWNSERNELPLKTITRSQADKLARDARRTSAHAGRLGDALRQSVDRARGSRRMQQAGCDRILIVPLYPQYAAATTATVCDKAFDALAHDALAAGAARRAAPITTSRSISTRWPPRSKPGLAKLPFKPDVILASFHGMPEDYLAQGRSLSLPLRRDHAAAAREAQARRGAS